MISISWICRAVRVFCWSEANSIGSSCRHSECGKIASGRTIWSTDTVIKSAGSYLHLESSKRVPLSVSSLTISSTVTNFPECRFVELDFFYTLQTMNTR